MKQIALYNCEPDYKNLALEKLRIYHQQKGDYVENYWEPGDHTYDTVYCSSIFDFTPKPKTDQRWICGGTGFDLTTKLPPEIEEVKPKLNFGFTTRGCIRNCKFCVVPQKEGWIHSVGDIYDLWDGERKNSRNGGEVKLLDNNILAMPDHFYKICDQLKQEKIKVDFNQGLDIRLLTNEMAKTLKTLRHKEYKFAFDHLEMELLIKKKVDMLQANGINRSKFYVLVGYDTTFKQDMQRIKLLRDLGQNAYVMRYKRDNIYIPLAEWANQPHIFHGMTWEQFLDHPEKQKYKPLFEMGASL